MTRALTVTTKQNAVLFRCLCVAVDAASPVKRSSVRPRVSGFVFGLANELWRGLSVCVVGSRSIVVLHLPRSCVRGEVDGGKGGVLCYSQGVRAAVFAHHANRSRFCLAMRLPSELYTRSRFCLAPSGEGFGDRLSASARQQQKPPPPF